MSVAGAARCWRLVALGTHSNTMWNYRVGKISTRVKCDHMAFYQSTIFFVNLEVICPLVCLYCMYVAELGLRIVNTVWLRLTAAFLSMVKIQPKEYPCCSSCNA